MNYIPGYGNPNARLIILGDCPAYDDKKAFDKAFDLKNILQGLTIPTQELWFTNVIKYHVMPTPKGRARIPLTIRAKNAGIDVDAALNDLHSELRSVNAPCILALGSAPLWATTSETSIANYRGSILTYGESKVVATYDPKGLSNPAYAEFKGSWNRSVIKFDINRAYGQAKSRGISRPYRTLSIAKSSHQIREFIGRIKNKPRVAADIEARGACIPFCIGFAATPSEGLTIPFWNRGEITSYYKVSDSEMVEMWLLIDYILNNFDIVGQNFKYDEDKLRMLGFQGRLISDLMMKSQALNPEYPKSLAFTTSVWTEEPFYKNDGMYEGAVENLLIGCARDACVTIEIDEKMEPYLDKLSTKDYYYNFLMKFHKFYLDIENEGFHINEETREKLFYKYINWSENLQYELFQLLGAEINIKSPKQVGSLLYDNFKIPHKQGTNEEVLTEILNAATLKLDENQRRAIENILEQRRVEKTISTYLAALPDYDGKMRTTYFPCLDTGRSSTGQLEPPIRPEIVVTDSKGKNKVKPIGTAFQTMTKHGDIGADVRSQYEPEKGHVLLQADSSQAEARVVWLLADDEEALELVDKVDYHALTATWFFGVNEELHNYDKKKLGYEHPIRFVGKTLRHAGHLGAGARRAATEVNTTARKFKIPIKITIPIAERSLKIFHAKQPRIRTHFHRGVIDALTRDKRMLVAAMPYGFDCKQGGKRTFHEKWEEELNRQAFSYIPQRSISDNTKAAGIRLRTREPRLTRIILEAHDSLLFTVPERELSYFAPLVKEEMERPLRFDTCSIPRRDLIIPCELEVGYNYMELEKYKI